jgi:WbqC-like protein family
MSPASLPVKGGDRLRGKAVAIVQSNYIPWKGYFDLVRSVDEFILFDDMQYTRRDWRNRNRIKSPHGLMWLTIPVESKGKYLQRIRDTVVSSDAWAVDHWRSIAQCYARAPFFKTYRDWLEDLYRSELCHGAAAKYLSEINLRFLTALCRILEIPTRITQSMDYQIVEGQTERLVSLCRQTGATRYLSGPSARDYIDTTLFAAADIQLDFMEYSGYPEYPQLYPPFRHDVSVIDLILHTGPGAAEYLRKL